MFGPFCSNVCTLEAEKTLNRAVQATFVFIGRRRDVTKHCRNKLRPCMSFSPSSKKSLRLNISAPNCSTAMILTPFCAIFARLSASENGVFLSATVVEIFTFYCFSDFG